MSKYPILHSKSKRHVGFSTETCRYSHPSHTRRRAGDEVPGESSNPHTKPMQQHQSQANIKDQNRSEDT